MRLSSIISALFLAAISISAVAQKTQDKVMTDSTIARIVSVVDNRSLVNFRIGTLGEVCSIQSGSYYSEWTEIEIPAAAHVALT
jgi:hypothetical protein